MELARNAAIRRRCVKTSMIKNLKRKSSIWQKTKRQHQYESKIVLPFNDN